MSVGGEGAGLAAQVRGDHPICDARPADLTQWRSAALLHQLIVHHQLTDRRPSHHQQLRWSTMTPSSASLNTDLLRNRMYHESIRMVCLNNRQMNTICSSVLKMSKSRPHYFEVNLYVSFYEKCALDISAYITVSILRQVGQTELILI